jgi:RimJ/RimL family protein N-acetyltransferase
MGSPGWPAAAVIETARLRLEPLRVEHAEEMAPVLGDQSLHEHIGGNPPTLEQLRERYARQVVGHSADDAQGWLNWIVRDNESGATVGTVQATLHEHLAGRPAAQIAWIIGSAHQGRGYAKEAASGMVGWLRLQGIDTFIAHIHPEHAASIGVARHLGLRTTDVLRDAEVRWVS